VYVFFLVFVCLILFVRCMFCIMFDILVEERSEHERFERSKASQVLN
jgi:hypothetical protein